MQTVKKTNVRRNKKTVNWRRIRKNVDDKEVVIRAAERRSSPPQLPEQQLPASSDESEKNKIREREREREREGRLHKTGERIGIQQELAQCSQAAKGA
jgi:hypothetical protein